MMSFVEMLNSKTTPYLVAEIGVNHEGNLQKAKDLAGLAHTSGADAVKFQTFIPELYISRDESQRFERVSKFALSYDDFLELKNYCDLIGISFFSTPLSPLDVEFLDPLVSIFKISSGDLTNNQLLQSVAKKGKPTILSTGYGSYSEIERSLEVFRNNATQSNLNELVLMHTVPMYPTPTHRACLRNILGLKERFGLPVGYSDHTIGIEAALISQVLGAQVIEKHFTDRKTDRTFRDHALSAEPNEFSELKVRLEEQAKLLGSAERKISQEESIASLEFRRSLAVSVSLPKGHKLESQDLCLVRPGTGINPEAIPYILGRQLSQDKSKGSILKFEDLI